MRRCPTAGQPRNQAGPIAVPILSRGAATDAMERDRADHFEPQAQVKVKSATVRRAYMEPGHEPGTTMIAHQPPDQARSKALSTMCRMCADAADLGVAFEHQSFAAHGDQFVIRSHAVVRAHFARTSAKKAGEREVCERQHFTGIGTREPDNLNRRIGQHHFLGQHHLKTLERFFKTNLRQMRIIFANEPYKLTRRE